MTEILVPRDPTDLVPGNSPEASVILAEKVAEAHRTRRANDKAPRTMESYKTHLQNWARWCQVHGLEPFPASTDMVLAYLHDLEPALAKPRGEPGRISIATMKARLAALAYFQAEVGAPPVTRSADVLGLVRALVRKYNTPQDAKRPVVVEHLRQMVAGLPNTLAGHRDRALLLLGVMGALRRSEISGLHVEHIRAVSTPEDGLELTIWKSKTDQTAQGYLIGLVASHNDLCPADALVRWLDEAGIESGPIFWPVNQHGQIVRKAPLTGHGIALIVKRHAETAGLDPEEFSGHSLRAGFATSAAERGSTLIEIAAHTRHRNLETLRRYVRHGTLFTKGNPTRGLTR